MTERTPERDDGEDVEPDARRRRRGGSGKKRALFAVLSLLLLLGAGAAAYMTGIADRLLAGDGEARPTAVFLDVPTLLVNLNDDGATSTFLKLSVALELASAAAKKRVSAVMPRVVDAFQVYLRELRVEDLQGSAGLQRLREDLLLRANMTLERVRARNVLFKGILVQ